jgi:hypothetical protein
MIRAEGNPALGPYTEGEKTNPADDLLMADTGVLTYGGNYEVIVTIGASAAAHFALQRRNTADGANVGNVPIIYGPAGQSGQYRFVYKVEAGERIRVIMDDALTGTAAVSLNLEHLL